MDKITYDEIVNKGIKPFLEKEVSGDGFGMTTAFLGRGFYAGVEWICSVLGIEIRK